MNPATNGHRRRVPEVRKKLAGGEAQRHHRIDAPAKCGAPAGREKYGGSLARVSAATSWDSGIITPSRVPPGRNLVLAGAVSGGSAALHHRLISSIPPGSSATHLDSPGRSPLEPDDTTGFRCCRGASKAGQVLSWATRTTPAPVDMAVGSFGIPPGRRRRGRKRSETMPRWGRGYAVENAERTTEIR